jgi:phosphoserine phosphatase
MTLGMTGGSIDALRKAQHDFGIDHVFGNELVIKDNKVTGEFLWPIGPGYHKKAEIVSHTCEDLNIDLGDVLYIGDAHDDIEAFKLVGTSIAFNSDNEELKDAATHIIDSDDLRDIIPFLG